MPNGFLLEQTNSSVTRGGGQMGAVAPGCSRHWSAKHPHQKYFVTNNHKSEFDIVFRIRQSNSFAVNLLVVTLLKKLSSASSEVPD